VGEMGAAARLVPYSRLPVPRLLVALATCFSLQASVSFYFGSLSVSSLLQQSFYSIFLKSSLSIQKKSSLCTPLANKLLISYFILPFILLPGPFVALNSVLLHYTFDTSLLEELKVEMIIIFMTISTKKRDD
jgi:hypothetical protein